MNETSPQSQSGSSTPGSGGMPTLQPIGGGPDSETSTLQPVSGGLASIGGASPSQPQSTPLHYAASPQVRNPVPPPPPYDAPRPVSRAARPANDEEDAVSAGRMVGSILTGLLVGGLCLLGWRWLWDNFGFNLSLIAIAVGFLVGFTMATVAGIGTRGNAVITGIAGLLGLGFSVAGVWPSLTSGRIFGLLFGILCAVVGAGAAIKAAGGGDDSFSDD